jgi:protein O-mannosyl-transferase
VSFMRRKSFDGLSLDEWATADQLGITAFAVKEVARFYPQLYRRRYAGSEEAGYAFLEGQMEGKEPSFGYSVLAYLLSETPHRVVVTTNFDNLVADALSIHSSRFPLVIGHDALAQYAGVELRRPLVAKIHGALGFSPKNQPEDISSLPEGWRISLGRILERYTPIVIGYEGNDGSLMGFLRSLPLHIPDRILWCVYSPDGKASDCLEHVSQEVRDYVKSRRGRFVPIRGFDELMAKLLTKLKEKGSVPDLYERLRERHRQRERNYDDQQRRLFEAASKDREKGKDQTSGVGDLALSEAVSEIAESRKEKPWWVWAGEADSADNLDRTDEVYRQAVQALPNDPDMLRTYAYFLEGKLEQYDKAEEFYLRALKEDPMHSSTLGFYGDFLDSLRNAPDRAEEYFRRALLSDYDGGDAPYIYTRSAQFFQKRNEMDEAEKGYLKALQVNPTHPYALKSYVQFLRNVRGDEEKALELEQNLPPETATRAKKATKRPKRSQK